MSVIKGDGGGTQYSFLEAWDAGAFPIINKKWIMEGDDMVHDFNCWAVQDENQLAEALSWSLPHPEQKKLNMDHCLTRHDPIHIGNEYKEFLGL